LTKRLKATSRSSYPSRAFLELAARRNIPITFGSDAHNPAEVGSDFAAALDLARSIGWTLTRRFEKRKFADVPL
jgi:histidinol-phosphatase (PHP family)